MRIQHNIAAMNSYRNFNTQNSGLSKNLEKLSSGYKINRAGDDAAGLAISEKMRAQITGLEVAQKNAKDGISVVQTAEGALTEVHDMLNRMYNLAEQSANGIYSENERDKLQAEMDQLTDEIDRIADSTNFNGMNLLDGTLASNASKASAITALGEVQDPSLVKEGQLQGAASKNHVRITVGNKTTASTTGKLGSVSIGVGTTLKSLLSAATSSDAAAKKYSDYYDITMTDKDGNIVTEAGTGTVINLVAKTAGSAAVAITAGTNGANPIKVITAGKDQGTSTQAQYEVTIDASKIDQLGGGALIRFGTGSTNQIKFSAKAAGTGTNGAGAGSIGLKGVETAEDLVNAINISTLTGYGAVARLSDDGKSVIMTLTSTATGTAANVGGIHTNMADVISGTQTALGAASIGSNSIYAKLEYDLKASDLKEGDKITIGNATVTIGNTNSEQVTKGVVAKSNITSKLQAALENAGYSGGKVTYDGKKLTIYATDTTTTGAELKEGTGKVTITTAKAVKAAAAKAEALKSSATENGLVLQIGDTADEFNRLTVSIDNMHASALFGKDKLDIVDSDNLTAQTKSQQAMDTIKTAIDTVSATRGNLGAMQNRLEHTINNLSVTRENLQDAESTIRDTDVAEEMMAYTKNNILNQAAQAMLAQANQLPQGVLQLLG